MLRRCLLSTLVFVCLSRAQEYRSALTGRITDIQLAVAAASETMTVTDEAPALITATASSRQSTTTRSGESASQRPLADGPGQDGVLRRQHRQPRSKPSI